jgi:hypothetical protein
MGMTQINILTVAGVAGVLIIVALAILVVGIFIKRVLSRQGAFGSKIQQSHDLAKESVGLSKESIGIAKECLQVEREMLAAQKETNELLRKVAAKLDQKP